MDFWGTVLVLARRWHVAVAALVLTIIAAFAAYASVPDRYAASAVVLLAAPTTGPAFSADPSFQPNLTNPLLNFDDGLTNAATSIVSYLTTPQVAEQLGLPDDTGTTYDLHNGSSNPEQLIRSPFLFVYGESGEPARAREIVERVTARAASELDAQQASLGAARTTFITFNEIVAPGQPELLVGNRVRPVGVALLLGIIGSLTTVFAVDNVLTHRLRRKVEAPDGAGPGVDADTTAATGLPPVRSPDPEAVGVGASGPALAGDDNAR